MRWIPLLLVALLLAACVPLPPQTTPVETAAPLPVGAVEYNLGETTITQANFPPESRFREMPVRLNGVIAAPESGGPHPVIVILHGTHPGCPLVGEVDVWPCSPDVEQPNYRGFAYLAEALAEAGYVALAININAENTFGFGEPVAGERLAQIVDEHLAALETAAAGGENGFGVPLAGRADVGRVGLVGHSRGGEMALWLAREDAKIEAVLQVAASPVSVDPADGSPVPLAAILPMCDGDVIGQDGQHFYEGARQAVGQTAWAVSAFLEGANHNAFNTILGPDPFSVGPGRPDCDERLDAETQRDFLAAYSIVFFDSIFTQGPHVEQNLMGLGLHPALPALTSLGSLEGRAAALYPAGQRTVLFTPLTEDELATNRLGGAVSAEGVTTRFCPAGYYTPAMLPGSEPCRRVNVSIPGQPALAVVTWEGPAALEFAIPEGAPGGGGDLSEAQAISLRAAVDPLSELNPSGAFQSLGVRITDGKGQSATVMSRPNEPALRFPEGEAQPDAMFGDIFSGRVPLTTLRVPMVEFRGVDLSDVREVALVFERTGALFLGDVEWVR